MKNLEKKASYILCAMPFYGMLDQWLPWVCNADQESQLIVISPHPGALASISERSVFHRLLDTRAEAIVVKLSDTYWVSLSSLGNATRFERLHAKGERYLVLLDRFGWVTLTRFLERIRAKLACFLSRGKRVSLNDIFSDTSVLLFDVTTTRSPHLAPLLKAAENLRKISMPHGLPINANNKKFLTDPKIPLDSTANRLTAVAFTDELFSLYTKYLRAYNAEILKLPIPRHDPNWIHIIASHEKGDIPWESYIVILSRGSNETYLPLNRKLKYLSIIQTSARKLKLPIVIKRHPTESEDEVFYKALGKDSYGDEWTFSDSHVFKLGEHALFSVSFISSTCLDLLAQGVPTIELIDMVGLNKKAWVSDVAMTANGEIISNYSNKGLVLLARNREEFEVQAQKILHDRTGVIDTLYQKYKTCFVAQ